MQINKQWMGYGLVGALALALAGCGGVTKGPMGQSGPDGSAGYMITSLHQQEPITVDGLANSQHDHAYYYDKQMGDVDRINIIDGQTVRKGDVLFTYHMTGDISEQIEDAHIKQTRLYNQRAELIDELSKTTGKLYNYQGDLIEGYWAEDGQQYYYVSEAIGKGGGPRVGQAVDPSIAGQDMAGQGNEAEKPLKSQIRELNQQIEDTELALTRLVNKQNGKITAKYDGVAVVNPAGLDDPSIPIVRVISDQILVKGNVTEYEYFLLQENLPVEIYVNAEDRNVSGHIADYNVYPNTAAPVTRAGEGVGGGDTTFTGGSASATLGGGNQATQYGFVVEPDDRIHPGFSVKISMTAPGLVVPNEAIVEEQGKMYVYVYRDGQAHKTAVDLKRQGANRVALTGLQEGDQLILNPVNLTDGQSVDVIDQNALPTEEQNEPHLQVKANQKGNP